MYGISFEIIRDGAGKIIGFSLMSTKGDKAADDFCRLLAPAQKENMARVALAGGYINFTIDDIPKDFVPKTGLGVHLIPYKGYERANQRFKVSSSAAEEALRSLLDIRNMTEELHLRAIGVNYINCVGFTLIQSQRMAKRRKTD